VRNDVSFQSKLINVTSDPEVVFSMVNITKEQREVLLDTICKKMTSNPLKIRCDFALTCTSFEGVDVIKEALLTAKHQVNVDGWKLEFKMIAPPNYKCEVVTHRKAEGEVKLK
jgi:translation initiation factor 2 subunit 1